MINVKNISIKYRLLKERPRTFQEHIIDYLRAKRKEVEVLWALRDISLDVKEGDSLGIIGHNGAGKSTLLKVISNVIKPSAGSVQVSGKIAPLIELGAGFDAELTGKENIYLNASILGFSRRDIEMKFDNILDFSELSDFVNTPLNNYSSGMIARLGFSIATEVDPDILIIDEILAVGDVSFRDKSRDKIIEFKNKGVTLLFVSHSTEDILSLCDKVLWLDHGKIKMLGQAEEVVNEYQSFSNKS